jgi:hypothetical protein
MVLVVMGLVRTAISLTEQRRKPWGGATLEAFDGRSRLQTALPAGDAQKESPGLVTKARSRGRPSFYAVTSSFSSSDDAPTISLKVEAGATPIGPTAGSCYLTTSPPVRRLQKPKVDVPAARE